MDRRWQAGWTGVVSGVQFRLVEGKKAPTDLRMEVRVSFGWRPVDMAMAAMLTDFFVDNEEHLRPFRPHWQQTGADYFFGYLHEAVKSGWESADANLQEQRQASGVVTPQRQQIQRLPAVPEMKFCSACHSLHPPGTSCDWPESA